MLRFFGRLIVLKPLVILNLMQLCLAHDLFLIFKFLLGPLYNYLNVLVFNFHLSFFVSFLQISINLLNFHHLLKDEVSVLCWFKSSACIALLRFARWLFGFIRHALGPNSTSKELWWLLRSAWVAKLNSLGILIAVWDRRITISILVLLVFIKKLILLDVTCWCQYIVVSEHPLVLEEIIFGLLLVVWCLIWDLLFLRSLNHDMFLVQVKKMDFVKFIDSLC